MYLPLTPPPLPFSVPPSLPPPPPALLRRPGDLDEVYSDPSKAERELGWKATRNLDDMTRDLWRWQQQNPHGYK